MSHPSIQLLDPLFNPDIHAIAATENVPDLRFVVKLREGVKLHYDLCFELYGRLLTFTFDEHKNCWSKISLIRRIEDQDLKHLMREHGHASVEPGSVASIVWDHGIYRTREGAAEAVYKQLLKGSLEIDLQGIRLNGRFRIRFCDKSWQIERHSGDYVPTSHRSVLTGRSLDELESASLRRSAQRLWLEWEHFYTSQAQKPEVTVLKKKVVDLNFAAKSQGITHGMLLQHVLPLIPGCHIKQLSLDPSRQEAWLNRLLAYSDKIEPLSFHSSVVDLSAHPDPTDIAGKIITKLTKSSFGYLRYGVGPSVWIARLAAKLNDPFRFAIDPGEALAPLSIDNLLAVSTEDRARLLRLGFETIGEVAKTPPERLFQQFGQSAFSIITAARGETHDQVASLYPPKAVTQTIAFEAPIKDELTLLSAAEHLSKQLAKKIVSQQSGLVILTAELEDSSERSLCRPYNRPVHCADRIRASLAFLTSELQKTCPDIVRLTARLDKLEPIKSSQQNLFVATSRTDSRTVLNSLKSALGSQSIILASEIEAPRRDQVLKVWRNATGWD